MKRWAVDTNVLVRILIQDDAEQTRRARDFFADGDALLLHSTVLLELEWVLRSVLRYARADVARAFADLLALPGLTFADESAALRAIEMHAEGMDFADALHLVQSEGCDEFVTFDRDLARRANAAADPFIPVRLL